MKCVGFVLETTEFTIASSTTSIPSKSSPSFTYDRIYRGTFAEISNSKESYLFDLCQYVLELGIVHLDTVIEVDGDHLVGQVVQFLLKR